PELRAAMRKMPASFETTDRTVAVVASVAVTVAPGSDAPVSSTTVPVRVPVPCAVALRAATMQSTTTTNTRTQLHRTLSMHPPARRGLPSIRGCPASDEIDYVMKSDYALRGTCGGR